jgi:hypothetical protein
MMRALILAVVLLCACNCASTQSPSAVPVSPAPAVDLGSKKEAPSACVQACTDGRRMEAIGWEVIVSECEAGCAAEGGP